jgi:hypothetical protein
MLDLFMPRLRKISISIALIAGIVQHTFDGMLALNPGMTHFDSPLPLTCDKTVDGGVSRSLDTIHVENPNMSECTRVSGYHSPTVMHPKLLLFRKHDG